MAKQESVQMKDKGSISESDMQETLELLESFKKTHDQEQKLLADNAFAYYCLWLSFNNSQASNTSNGRVKIFPFPTPGNKL
jgi:hypothetical protein